MGSGCGLQDHTGEVRAWRSKIECKVCLIHKVKGVLRHLLRGVNRYIWLGDLTVVSL